MQAQPDVKEEIYTLVLILDNGETISIEYPETINDEIMEQVTQCAQDGTAWHCGDYMRLKATYKNQVIESVNMTRVIGWR